VHEADFDGFIWDAGKRECCYRERGFAFEYAAGIFESDFIEWEDRRRDYGEHRFVSVGEVGDVILAVVGTPRESVRRIISARPASRSEKMSLYAARKTH
jgi:uncharacterized DUF497 family protein